MGNSIMLDKSIHSSDNTILDDIDKFYDNIKKLEKKKISFLTHNNETALLNSILKNINIIIEKINLFSTTNKLFLTNDIIDYINKHKLSNKITVNKSSNFNREISANEILIKAIVILLSLMQIDENKVGSANIYLNLNKNSLSIQIPKFIDYTPEQESILLEKDTHKFIDKNKKFYGLYLFFINTIIKKLDATIKIYTKNSSKYKILINVPIKIEEDTIAPNCALISLRKKVAIYSQSKYIAHKIQNYLDEYNFYIKIIPYKQDINPNFLNYDLLIIDSELLNKKLSNNISKAENIKLILLKDNKNPKFIFKSIENKVLNKSFNKNELTFSIIELFNAEINSNNIVINNTKLNTNTEKKKVIIADSNLANLKLLEYMISKYNIDIYTSANGREVIKILEKYGADLIIVDSNLSSMDGYETTKLIRAKNKYNHIPIVIHSSFTLNNQSISNIFLAGFDAYLPKPFSSKDINNILNRYLTIDQKSKKNISTKEFLALYKDIDALIEKYASNNKINNLKSLLSKLKEELSRLEQHNLTSDIDDIILSITLNNTVDKILVKNFINKFRSYIFSVTN